MTETFKNNGCSPEEASRIAVRLSGANLRGHDSHGVIRVPRYVDYLNEGKQIAGVTAEIITESDILAVIDGKFGFGQTVGEQAIDIGIKKAKAFSISNSTNTNTTKNKSNSIANTNRC